MNLEIGQRYVWYKDIPESFGAIIEICDANENGNGLVLRSNKQGSWQVGRKLFSIPTKWI